jgi:hypothetical protein
MSPAPAHGRAVDRDKAGRPRAHDLDRDLRARAPAADDVNVNDYGPALDARSLHR